MNSLSDNSILIHRNKFISLKTIISENFYIPVIAETKLDSTFTTAQFFIKGFQNPIRHDRNAHGGGLMIYIRNRVPAKELSDVDIPIGIKCGIIEINLHKKKWIMLGVYHPSSQSESEFFENLGKILDTHTMKSDNFILIGDFNAEESSDNVSNFMNLYGMANLVKVPTCFKAVTARCIDLILTNNVQCFKDTKAIETGLSDFHSMVVTVVKTSCIKRGPRVITYRDYSKFNSSTFKENLKKELQKDNSCFENYETFSTTVQGVLDNHAPIKNKSVRANDAPFMIKTLRKAIMNRTRLRNIYCKDRTADNLKAYKKQRNKCVNILRPISEIVEQVDNLDTKKASPIDIIPAKVIKDNVDIVASYLLHLFNKSFDGNFFPNEMKDGDVSALFKNSNSFHKKNYRLITVLPSVSKIIERLLAKQMLPSMNKFLSPKSCCYRPSMLL